MFSDVNWLAILVAAVVNMVVGSAWYSPLLFVKPWMKALGKSQKEMQETSMSMGVLYGLAFVSSLVTAFVLSKFIGMSTAPDWMTGAMVGFFAWLGFVATSILTNILFEGRSNKLFFIYAGYFLVVLVINGALLGAWR